MSREKATYEDNIRRIKDIYPEKEMLNPNEVSRFTGLDVRTCKEIFPFRIFGKTRYISVATLARTISV